MILLSFFFLFLVLYQLQTLVAVETELVVVGDEGDAIGDGVGDDDIHGVMYTPYFSHVILPCIFSAVSILFFTMAFLTSTGRAIHQSYSIYFRFLVIILSLRS